MLLNDLNTVEGFYSLLRIQSMKMVHLLTLSAYSIGSRRNTGTSPTKMKMYATPSLEDQTYDLVVKRPVSISANPPPSLYDTNKEAGLHTQAKNKLAEFTLCFLLKHSYPSHRFSHSGRTKYRHQWGLPRGLWLRETSHNAEVLGSSPQVSFSNPPVVTMNTVSYIIIGFFLSVDRTNVGIYICNPAIFM